MCVYVCVYSVCVCMCKCVCVFLLNSSGVLPLYILLGFYNPYPFLPPFPLPLTGAAHVLSGLLITLGTFVCWSPPTALGVSGVGLALAYPLFTILRE